MFGVGGKPSWITSLNSMLGSASSGLAVDFRTGMMLARGGSTPYIGPLSGKFTYTSPSTKYVRDSAGTLVAGTTLRCHYGEDGLAYGLLCEEQRINKFLNSAIGVTQAVTVTAVAHTLSFRGTGTITLSGVSTAGPLVGTGANAFVSLTFTPTAGSLTLTVAGDVRNVNLEVGAYSTSWIETTGAQVTRAADDIRLDTSLFPYNQFGAGTLVWVGRNLTPDNGAGTGTVGSATAYLMTFTQAASPSSNAIELIRSNSSTRVYKGELAARNNSATTTYVDTTEDNAALLNARKVLAGTWGAATGSANVTGRVSANGVAAVSSAVMNPPSSISVTRLVLGYGQVIEGIVYLPELKSAADLQTLSGSL